MTGGARQVPVPPPSTQTGRQCQGKRAHPKRRDAATAAAGVRARTGDDNVRPYRCDLCGFWHVGHDKYWKAAR